MSDPFFVREYRFYFKFSFTKTDLFSILFQEDKTR